MSAYEILLNGDSALTVLFKDAPSLNLSKKLIMMASELRNKFPTQIVDIIPAYQTLTLYFNTPNIIDAQMKYELNDLLTQTLKTSSQNISFEQRTVEIPVCYDEEFALDMAEAKKLTGLTKQTIIERHTAADYYVNMLGFLPGFFYLSGLQQSLVMPRKTNPRTVVPKGAVGIGGSQTGVYPVASPGGWQIIGQTPLTIFSPYSESPFLVRPLDKIKFIAIDKENFYRIQSAQQDIQ